MNLKGRAEPRSAVGRKNWLETIPEDLLGLTLTLKNALDAAEDRDG